MLFSTKRFTLSTQREFMALTKSKRVKSVGRSRPKHWTRRPIVITLVVLAVLLFAIRLALPSVVTRYVNRVLNGIENHEGHISDVDLHLWRGAYSIYDLEIVQVSNDGKRAPIISIPATHLSVEWRALLHGSLVGEVEFHRPRVNVYAGTAKKEEKEKSDDFLQQFRELLPLNINRFAIIDGELHFQNLRANPEVDIYLDQISLVARNLTNSEEVAAEELAATVSGKARAMKSGALGVEMKLDPLKEHPTYQLAFELKDLRLPELNNFLRYYLAVTARDGWISMAGESNAEGGKFRGYVKPVVRDLDILHLKKEHKSIGEAIKGFFVKIIASVFENKAKEQLATKLEFSGTFDNPEISVWDAVASFMRNAFVQALEPSLEGTLAPEQAKKESGKLKDSDANKRGSSANK